MMSFRLGLILVTFFILEAYGSAKVENGHVSVWDSVIREKREATADKETVKVDCKSAQDLDTKCKEDSCPLDDKTVETCCQCVETCCSSEQAPDEPTTDSPSNSTSTSTDQAKKKVTDTVSKIEGFLTNVGKDIRSVVTKGWDKVKSTTMSVEESARKGINQGAAWVHNKTDSEPSAGNKTELCKDKKSGAISTTPTHINGTFIDMNCTTDLGIKPLDDETSSESPDAQPTTTAKPTKKTKRSAANNEKSNVDKGQSKSDSPGQTEPTSPSPTKKNKRNTDFPSGNGPIREMKVNNTKSNTRLNTASNSSDSMEVQSTTEKKPVMGMRKSKRQVQNSPYEENSNRQNWSSSSSSSSGQTPGANQGTGNYNMGGGTDGSSYTSSQMTSSSSSNMGGNGANRGSITVSKESQYRQRRDIPPGMVAKKLANEAVNSTTSLGETPQRSSRYAAPPMDTATTTMKSMSSMNDKDGSKDLPSGQNRNKREAAPPASSTMRPPPANNSSLLASKSIREAAPPASSTMSPPPANNSSLLAPKSKTEAPSAMVTTASPMNSTSRSKRQAPPPPSSTMNPMSSTSKTPLKSKGGAPTSIMTTMNPLNNSTMTQQRSKREALSPPSMTMPNSPCSSRSRRAAAGPPVNSQSQQTTPMPAGDSPCPNDKKRSKRRAFYKKQKTAAPATTTFDPLEDSDSSTTEETFTQPPRRDTSRRDSTTKPRRDKDNNVWITVSASAAKPRDKIPNGASHAQGPIRAPGSVDPEDILDMPISNQNDGGGGERGRRPFQGGGGGNSNYDRDSINHGSTGSRGGNGFTGNFIGGSGNSVLRPLPPADLSTSSSSEDSSPILSNPDPSVPKLKPGQCRPLSHGLQCVSLGRDAAQCKDDSGCQETKKCCFYSCTPNQDIGVCEHPIFS